MKKKTILFFSPYFGYTGSEIMLLELIKGLDKTVYSPHLFLFTRGELSNEIPNDIPYYFPQRRKKNWKARLKKTFGRKQPPYDLKAQLSGIQNTINADVWYVNTIAIPAEIYEIAASYNIKVVTHIHELLFAYGFFPDRNLKNILGYSNKIIGCSQTVCHSIKDLGFSQVMLQYNFINPAKIEDALINNPVTRSMLGIRDDEFIWVVSARSTFLKGIDYLKEILPGLSSTNYRILWLGSTEGTSLSHYIETWLNIHHPGKVIFTGKLVDEYYSYMALADGFLIPSREESFSLVAVEATYLGLPVVCFDYGAAEEVINGRNGTIVRSWNVPDLTKAMLSVMSTRPAGQLKERNYEIPFTKEVQLPKFHQLLDAILYE